MSTNRTSLTRLVNVRLPHRIADELDQRVPAGQRTDFIRRAIERALAGDDDAYRAGLRVGSEQVFEMMERQRENLQRYTDARDADAAAAKATS